MKPLKFSRKAFIPTVRYLAHLFSILLIFVVILLALGETFPNSFNLTSREFLLTTSLFVILAGLFSAWKWEGIGGALIIVGFLVFIIINAIFSDYLKLGIFFLLFPLTGLLYLVCCFSESKPKHRILKKF
ncbi:MAG: hypothetical protein KKF62_05870 [Bacteroidetes bacterium]|nr:hypothetical protein [Bacteroidota bacterium]MBU1115878.1 hypothetical protein [Bacteroidota bacterium]MBU1797992.1 hypothetical protein [Bacteroidota bacterium]